MLLQPGEVREFPSIMSEEKRGRPALALDPPIEYQRAWGRCVSSRRQDATIIQASLRHQPRRVPWFGWKASGASIQAKPQIKHPQAKEDLVAEFSFPSSSWRSMKKRTALVLSAMPAPWLSAR